MMIQYLPASPETAASELLELIGVAIITMIWAMIAAIFIPLGIAILLIRVLIGK